MRVDGTYAVSKVQKRNNKKGTWDNVNHNPPKAQYSANMILHSTHVAYSREPSTFVGVYVKELLGPSASFHSLTQSPTRHPIRRSPHTGRSDT